MRVKLLALHGRYQNATICVERIAGTKLSDSPALYRFSECGNSGSRTLQHNHFQRLDDDDKRLSCEVSSLPQESLHRRMQTPRIVVRISDRRSKSLEIEIVSLNAPHVVCPAIKMKSNSSVRLKRTCDIHSPHAQTRSWWVPLDDSDTALDQSLSQCLNLIHLHDRHDVPFDGVIGFSQGASLGSLMFSPPYSEQHNLKYAVFCSGYLHPKASIRKTRSLHIFSPLDHMVSRESSLKLAKEIGNLAVVAEHQGGHSVPVPWLYAKLLSFFCQPSN